MRRERRRTLVEISQNSKKSGDATRVWLVGGRSPDCKNCKASGSQTYQVGRNKALRSSGSGMTIDFCRNCEDLFRPTLSFAGRGRWELVRVEQRCRHGSKNRLQFVKVPILGLPQEQRRLLAERRDNNTAVDQ